MPNRFSCVLVVVLVSAAIPLQAVGQLGIFTRGGSDLRPFVDPNGKFTLSSPKNWRTVLASGDVLVTFAQEKGEAALVVERVHMNQALAPEDITELFAELEGDTIKQRQASATDVTAQVVDDAGRRLVTADYTRKGLSGAERVRQYSFPVGDELYRVTCSAQSAQFRKYEPICTQVAASFKATK